MRKKICRCSCRKNKVLLHKRGLHKKEIILYCPESCIFVPETGCVHPKCEVMKRIFCPKCDNQLAFDETRFPEGKVLAFVCPQCGSQFKIRLGRKVVRTKDGEMQEVKEADFSKGYISVIENAFGYKQKLPLVEGDNVIGRRNKDTDGVDVPIITSDPSMARKHCVIHVKSDGTGHYIYTLRDFPSLTGTFLANELVGKNERIRIENEAIVTIGATTFILHTPDGEES